MKLRKNKNRKLDNVACVYITAKHCLSKGFSSWFKISVNICLIHNTVFLSYRNVKWTQSLWIHDSVYDKQFRQKIQLGNTNIRQQKIIYTYIQGKCMQRYETRNLFKKEHHLIRCAWQ